MTTPYINPFYSQHVDILWNALLVEFGRAVDYWPGGEIGAGGETRLIWVEGVEDEEISPGRYSHAMVRNASLPAPPALGDALERDGVIYDVVRVNAFSYHYSRIVLQERG